MITIAQIQKVVSLNKTIKNKKCDHTPDLMSLFSLVENLVLKQTNLGSLELVDRVLKLYDSCKKDNWFKQGLQRVLLEGSFPVVVKEVPVPAQKWNEPPTINPFHPIVTFGTSTQLNDYRGMNDILNSLEKMLK